MGLQKILLLAAGASALVLGCSTGSLGGSNPVPLPSGSGKIGVIYSNALSGDGSTYWGGLFGGTLTFDSQGRLTDYTDSGGFDFSESAVGDFNADGTDAWGRWTSGTASGISPSGTMPVFHYVASETDVDATTLATLVKSYSSVASDAPTLDTGNGIIAGEVNGATGTLSVDYAAGTFSYTISVAVGAHRFSLSGSGVFVKTGGSQDSRFGDNTVTITSTTDDASNAQGKVPYFQAMQGELSGASAERAGINYAFTVPSVGMVSGALVLE